MRRSWIVLVLAACVSASAWADSFDDDNGQNSEPMFRQCVSQSMQSTHSMLGFQIMQNACLKLYRESTMISDSQKAYYVCLLRNLQGANNDIYVQKVAKACGDHR